MSLTKFGQCVRESRRELDITLSMMASDLKTSPAFLSAMETGRSKVPVEWAEKISKYFSQAGKNIDSNWLRTLASEANKTVSLEGLPPHHRMLVAGFANSDLNQEQLTRLGKVLYEIYGEKIEDGDRG